MKKEIPTFITFAFLLALAEHQGMIKHKNKFYHLLWSDFETRWQLFNAENISVSYPKVDSEGGEKIA